MCHSLRYTVLHIFVAILLTHPTSGASKVAQSTSKDVVSTVTAANTVAQARVSKAFAAEPNLHELVCKPPSAVGFVKKSASATIALGSTLQPSRLAFFQFKKKKIPIYDSCAIWVSDKYRFIYIRQPKSSSKSVIHAVKKDICGGRCKREEFRQVTDLKALLRAWDSYFVFTIVRNPWTRALSAYSMFHKSFLYREPEDDKLNTELPPSQRCGISFAEYSEDVAKMRDICDTDACCSYIRRQQLWKPNFVNIHIGDHSHCMFLPRGAPIVDYIGMTETFDLSWKVIADEITRRNGYSNGSQKRGKIRKDLCSDYDSRAAFGGNRTGGAGGDLPCARGDGGGSGVGMLAVVGPGVDSAATGGYRGSADSATPRPPGLRRPHWTPHQPLGGLETMAGGRSLEAEGARGPKPEHKCSSDHALHYLNATIAHNIARQYALDVVRLGYL